MPRQEPNPANPWLPSVTLANRLFRTLTSLHDLEEICRTDIATHERETIRQAMSVLSDYLPDPKEIPLP